MADVQADRAQREPRAREREDEIAQILAFVEAHPESYASLAVCRRSLDGGLPSVTAQAIDRLRDHLRVASD